MKQQAKKNYTSLSANFLFPFKLFLPRLSFVRILKRHSDDHIFHAGLRYVLFVALPKQSILKGVHTEFKKDVNYI